MNEKEHICLIEEDHPDHLCMLANNKKIAEIKKLMRNPKFVFFNCGRVADSNKNLCNPMPLD
jgi:hypothetical protein